MLYRRRAKIEQVFAYRPSWTDFKSLQSILQKEYISWRPNLLPNGDGWGETSGRSLE